MASGPHLVHPGTVQSSLRLSLRLGAGCVMVGRRSTRSGRSVAGGLREACESLRDRGGCRGAFCGFCVPWVLCERC